MHWKVFFLFLFFPFRFKWFIFLQFFFLLIVLLLPHIHLSLLCFFFFRNVKLFQIFFFSLIFWSALLPCFQNGFSCFWKEICWLHRCSYPKTRNRRFSLCRRFRSFAKISIFEWYGYALAIAHFIWRDYVLFLESLSCFLIAELWCSNCWFYFFFAGIFIWYLSWLVYTETATSCAAVKAAVASLIELWLQCILLTFFVNIVFNEILRRCNFAIFK